MPAIYQPRRPRASPLWQIVHHGWDAFLALYEKFHRKTLGPLDPAAVATVQSFLRCGDLASGFTRLQCPDCGHERLLAFTCKAASTACPPKTSPPPSNSSATASSTPSAMPNSSAPEN